MLFCQTPLTLLHRLATSALLLVSLWGSLRSVQAAAPPNIVLVYIDDMGWGDMACFGSPDSKTPNLDRLASEGVRFHQFYVNAPICSPSRCAITTGQYPQRWRITSYLDNRRSNARRGVADWLDPEAPTIARTLHGQGYATGHFGKWHMGGQRNVGDAPLIIRYGFDESLTNFEGLGARLLPLCYSSEDDEPKKHALGSDNLGKGPIFWRDRAYITQDFVEATINFMRASVHRGQPFYANVWPDDVHTPLYPPLELRGDESKRGLYLGVLEAMDDQLGKLFDEIRDDPKLRDNTLVILASDNGPEPGAGSAGEFRGHKGTLYEGGIRSPLIVWGPGIMAPEAAGSINRESVLAAFDMMPTLCQLAGVPETECPTTDGEALVDVLRGASNSSRTKPLFFRRPPDRNGNRQQDLPDLAVRSGNWKLLCEYDGSKAELYELHSDPGEQNNAASIHPEVVQQLTAEVLSWHSQMPSDKGLEWEQERGR